jgi:hypothetical protein
MSMSAMRHRAVISGSSEEYILIIINRSIYEMENLSLSLKKNNEKVSNEVTDLIPRPK